ncbi:tetratricopeptide repeat protein [Nocardia asteroides]|uniref:tetratricopeptide repeat protein n=1 Tax=Nocardia asteroides TaxID=1824 RepID=UPI001E2D17A7|nr:tetratricopeptide repeat protein [Nocardia asteroides]UGT60147.1 tetratricopeptide repeat protein [Nocardia asteroides]
MTTADPRPQSQVFCSCARPDLDVVKPFVERLRAAGVDARLEEWEVRPGDDVVAIIGRSIDSSRAALIFVSRNWFDGAWVQDQFTSLIYNRVEKGIRVIPIMVEEILDLPADLAKLKPALITDFSAVRDTLLDRERRPGLGSTQRAVTRDLRIRVHLGAAELTTTLLDGTTELASDSGLPTAALTLDSARDLTEFGGRLTASLLPAATGTRLDAELGGLGGLGAVADLVFELPGELQHAAVEATVLPSGLVPAVAPGIRLRRSSSAADPVVRTTAGPLKILAVVGAPDETRTGSAPLRVEQEMGVLIGAVGAAVDTRAAQVRILEVTTPTAIERALEQDAYHVVHLSGHGGPAGIEMHNEDGAPVWLTPGDFFAAMQGASTAIPLVFVSACDIPQSGDSFAAQLHHLGIPQVITMQAPVSDDYATLLAMHFYRQLATHVSPRTGAALATARRAVEADETRPRRATPEWPVPALWANDDGPLIDPELRRDPLRGQPRMALLGEMPLLGPGELIGRRRELRDTMRALRAPQSSGAVLTGIGGTGKSSIAGRAAARALAEDYVCAVVSGAWNLERICANLADALADAAVVQPDSWVALAVARATRPRIDDQSRILLLTTLLRSARILLVIDNFETNLTADGTDFTDPGIESVLRQLVISCGTGTLLITSRYPLPGLRDLIQHIPIGPLSANETRRLIMRLSGLDALASADRALVHRLIGGHPRALELLDAVLLRAASNSAATAVAARITAKLLDLAQKSGIDLDAPRTVEAGIDATIALGAADIALDTLLEQLSEVESEVLLQVAAANLPVPVDLLSTLLDEVGACPHEAMPGAIRRLLDLSLLAETEHGLWMHRWTAGAFEVHVEAGDWRRRCHQAGQIRLKQLLRSKHVADGIEATENFLKAESWDDAVGIGVSVAKFLSDPKHPAIHQRLSFTGLVAHALPTEHPGIHFFTDLETQALEALGFTELALDRAQSNLTGLDARATDEPGRTDYQRDLSVSYNKVGDLYRALGRGDDAMNAYQNSLTIAQKLATDEPGRTDYQRDLSISYDNVGDLYRALGRGDDAMNAYQNSLTIRQKLATDEPGRADYQRDLSVSYNRVGDLYQALGRGDDAMNAYQNSLTIRQKLATDEPGRTDYQRDLSISYDNVGDLYRALGRGDDAMNAHQNSLTIAQKLATDEPGRTDYQRDLSISYNRVGDLYQALGRGDDAMNAHQNSLTIAQKLATDEPGRTDYQRDLSISYNKVGDLYQALGRGDDAMNAYQNSLTIRQKLATDEPGRTDYQRDLSISYDNVGDLYRALGRGDDAMNAHQNSLTIAQKLATDEPGRTDYQRDLSISYNRVGDLYQALGRGDDAMNAYQNSLTIRQKLATDEPGRTDYQRDLSISYDNVGDLYRALGRGDDAMNAYQNSLTIAQKLATDEPGRTDYQRDLSISYNRVGDLYQALGRGDDAMNAHQNSLTIAQKLATDEPGRTDYQRDLSISYNRVGDLYQALGRGDDAMNAHQNSLTIAQKLATDEPGRTDYQRDLSVSYNKVGDLYQALGRGDDAMNAYQNSLTIRQKLATDEPGRADYQRDLSVSYQRLGNLHRELGHLDNAKAAFDEHLNFAKITWLMAPTVVNHVVDLALAQFLSADFHPDGDHRIAAARELLEQVGVDRLPPNGRALLKQITHDDSEETE